MLDTVKGDSQVCSRHRGHLISRQLEYSRKRENTMKQVGSELDSCNSELYKQGRQLELLGKKSNFFPS